MSIVFLDTVGLIAQWDTDDQWHALAEAAYQQIVDQRKSVLTTTFILLECGNTAARRSFRGDACALRQALELRNELVTPTEDDWNAAWAAYERGEAAQAGIVDHVLLRRYAPAGNQGGLHQRSAFSGRRVCPSVLSSSPTGRRRRAALV